MNICFVGNYTYDSILTIHSNADSNKNRNSTTSSKRLKNSTAPGILTKNDALWTQ